MVGGLSADQPTILRTVTLQTIAENMLSLLRNHNPYRLQDYSKTSTSISQVIGWRKNLFLTASIQLILPRSLSG